MPLYAITVAVLAIGFEQLVQLQFGPMGIIAFLALSIGVKARSLTVAAFGVLILLMLLAR